MSGDTVLYRVQYGDTARVCTVCENIVQGMGAQSCESCPGKRKYARRLEQVMRAVSRDMSGHVRTHGGHRGALHAKICSVCGDLSPGADCENTCSAKIILYPYAVETPSPRETDTRDTAHTTVGSWSCLSSSSASALWHARTRPGLHGLRPPRPHAQNARGQYARTSLPRMYRILVVVVYGTGV